MTQTGLIWANQLREAPKECLYRRICATGIIRTCPDCEPLQGIYGNSSTQEATEDMLGGSRRRSSQRSATTSEGVVDGRRRGWVKGLQVTGRAFCHTSLSDFTEPFRDPDPMTPQSALNKASRPWVTVQSFRTHARAEHAGAL